MGSASCIYIFVRIYIIITWEEEATNEGRLGRSWREGTPEGLEGIKERGK